MMNVKFDEFIECNNGINETWESITNNVYDVYPFIDFNFKDIMPNMLYQVKINFIWHGTYNTVGWVFDYELDVNKVSLTIINEIERFTKEASVLI